ncbi:hypothetical protein C8Q78DRAFT_1021540 [Trametes maxima]|nr:hypothetical protein C8Q78DRAFT_1021540 [Trametes maxima]
MHTSSAPASSVSRRSAPFGLASPAVADPCELKAGSGTQLRPIPAATASAPPRSPTAMAIRSFQPGPCPSANRTRLRPPLSRSHRPCLPFCMAIILLCSPPPRPIYAVPRLAPTSPSTPTRSLRTRSFRSRSCLFPPNFRPLFPGSCAPARRLDRIVILTDSIRPSILVAACPSHCVSICSAHTPPSISLISIALAFPCLSHNDDVCLIQRKLSI